MLEHSKVLASLVAAAVGVACGPAQRPGRVAVTKAPELPSPHAWALFNSTYASLAARVSDRGYAPTSLTDYYTNMYTRDASVNALALLLGGDVQKARAILRYIFRFSAAAGVTVAPHKIYDETDLLAPDEGQQIDAATIVAHLGGPQRAAMQHLPSTGLVTAVDVWLSATDQARGSVEATLRAGEGPTAAIVDRAQLAVQEVRAGGGWVTFRFLPPLFSTSPGDGYTLQLSAPDAPPSTVVWHGASGGSGLSLFTESGGWEPSPGAGAYRERLTTFEVTGEDAWDQTDQNYSVLWVWAWYARMHPEDAEFIQETWPLVRAFADHYIVTPGYLDPALDLVRNPILDAEDYHDTYDLLTNVFASQALHDLAPIALSLGDAEAATRWAAADERVRHGVEAHLVTVIDGKRIYGEKYELDEANHFYPGYQFVNLSPIAVEWYALDREIMANTVEAYATHASRDWSGITMLSSMQDYPSTERNDWVLAKALAWEWRFEKETGDLARVDVLDLFLRTYCPDTSQPVFEGWILDSGGALRATDPGNQEMASWFVVELLRAYPALSEPHGSPSATTSRSSSPFILE